LIEFFRSDRNPAKTRSFAEAAVKLKPRDGRFLHFLGYVLGALGEYEDAIQNSRKALLDTGLSDPMTAIQAMNNLAYYLADTAKTSQERWQRLREALRLSEFLPAYHEVFRPQSQAFLDTRGWVLHLWAEFVCTELTRQEEAKEASREAVKLLEEARSEEPQNTFIVEHLRIARELAERLGIIG